jgi:prophage regulatory protein
MENKIMIGKKTVIEMVGLSDSTIYRLEKKGDFPKRTWLSANRVGWHKQDVLNWIEKKTNA